MAGETALRLSAFFGIFAAMALWEIAAPMRARVLGRGGRWATNWGISILNAGLTAVMKAGLGAAAVIAAMDAADRMIRSQCRSRSGTSPSKYRAPSKTSVPSQVA